MSERMIKQLRTLLDQEKQALLRADFDSLEELAERKETLVQKLSAHPLHDSKLAELRDANAHNQALLAAIAKGISGVRGIVMDHHKARNTSFYQKDGTQSPLLPRSGKLAHRA
ncbi:hypothetical protein [Roseinatronobacter sp. NSM]|uniref:hypothetical protein n=1 Tax=Roseinatronobacter sp. NSM TaxID=3457785 RepID=UPI004036E6E2